MGFRQARMSCPRRRAGVSLGRNRTSTSRMKAPAVSPAATHPGGPAFTMAVVKAAAAPSRPPMRAVHLIVVVPGRRGGAGSGTGGAC